MRYIFAVICPPLAFLACGRWLQAGLAAGLFLLAAATAHVGVGVAIDFFLILWAFASVGDDDAHRESRGFIEAATSPNRRGW